MKQMKQRTVVSSLAAAALLGGCAVGPDFQSPETPATSHYIDPPAATELKMSIQLRESDTIPEQWWRFYQSETLNTLIEQGLQQNPSISAARANLLATRERLRADTGYVLFPRVDANASSARRKISGASFGNAGNPSIFNVHSASIDVDYTIDAFGGGQRYLEIGEAMVDYEALQLEAARQSIIANIVNSAVSIAALRAQIEATETIISDEEKSVELSRQQFEIGVISKTELLAQQSALAQRKSQLPPLNKALAEARHQLATLLGRMPTEQSEIANFDLSTLTLPEALPLTLPSTLTRRRPDVRAAEATLHQASAQIGVATANLYPKLSLSGSYGSDGTRIADLFTAGSSVWGIAAGLTQPLFRAGELRARKRAAEADFDKSAAIYRQSVLSAFQDVANALLAIEMDQREYELQKQAEAMAAETLDLIEQQHQQGAASYLALLDARKNLQQTRIGRIRTQAALLSDSAALMHALGGGWQGWQQDESTTERES